MANLLPIIKRARNLIPEVHGAWQLQQAGFIREVYLAPEWKAAVVIVEADTLLAAKERLAELPMVRDGLVEFDLTPLTSYSSLSLLFRSEFAS